MTPSNSPRPLRRIPALKLPPYAYCPGQNPHPFKDPKGHQYGADWTFPYRDDWRKDQGWLLGLDLFDHEFYWESHEVWEAQWKTRPRSCPSRALLQGMIQSAAALLKPLGSSSSQRLWSAAQGRLSQTLHFDRGVDVAATMSLISLALLGQGSARIVGGWP